MRSLCLGDLRIKLVHKDLERQTARCDNLPEQWGVDSCSPTAGESGQRGRADLANTVSAWTAAGAAQTTSSRAITDGNEHVPAGSLVLGGTVREIQD